jgi:hypothetical protein
MSLEIIYLLFVHLYVLLLQGAAWVYLLLGSAGQTGGLEDRVSASSGIASGTSSQPWLEDQVSTGIAQPWLENQASIAHPWLED